MNQQPWWRTCLVLGSFAVVFITLAVNSYVRESATADEPLNLTTGYTILRLGDYRIHPDNMPLLRVWAALPLLIMPGITLDTNSSSWVQRKRLQFAHEFVYQRNDADRMLNRARFMNVLLGVLLGAWVFFWAREWFGFWPAAVTLLLFATEPNLLAHSGLVTTDIGVSCLMFGTLYFTWRLSQRFTIGNLAGLTVLFVLSVLGKFTALLLLPIVLALLLIPVAQAQDNGGFRRRVLPRTALTVLGLIAAAYLGIWAAYGFRWAPTIDGPPFDFTGSSWVLNRTPHLAAVVRWIDSHHLLPNACTQGLLIEEARGERWPAYLAGRFSTEGWWYYFPVAFLIKTPVALLVLFFAGLGLLMRQRAEFWSRGIFVLLPLVAGFTVAACARLNVGLRHILPLYPFVLLAAATAVAALLQNRGRWRRLALGALCLTQVAELVTVYPHPLAFFNQIAGGPSRGYEWLADSNIDWGQDLKSLGLWMQEYKVTRINLSYFGSADPSYYKIACNYLPGSPYFVQDKITDPILPGYVAVSVHNLTGAGLRGNQFYAPLLAQRPVAVLGYSIHVYRADRPWW